MDLQPIIQKIKNGDQAAFRYLVEKYQQYAFRLAFRILCNEDDAKDTVQESFIKIWKNISKYDIKMKFTSWMYKIVTNSALDRLRSSKRTVVYGLEQVSDLALSLTNAEFNNQLDNIEAASLIALLAEGLSEKQRLVFVMRDLEGMPSDEVEEILGMNETSVKSNLYHARKAIKEKLETINTCERRRNEL